MFEGLLKENGRQVYDLLGSNCFNFWHVALCQRSYSRKLRSYEYGGNLFAHQPEISRFKTEMWKNGLKIGHT